MQGPWGSALGSRRNPAKDLPAVKELRPWRFAKDFRQGAESETASLAALGTPRLSCGSFGRPRCDPSASGVLNLGSRSRWPSHARGRRVGFRTREEEPSRGRVPFRSLPHATRTLVCSAEALQTHRLRLCKLKLHKLIRRFPRGMLAFPCPSPSRPPSNPPFLTRPRR